MDSKFDPIKADTDNAVISFNTISRDENEPVIECYIRTIKDRSISVWSTLTFEKVPVRMIIELVLSHIIMAYPPP